MLKCDKCNAAITPGSKFCPQCGDPVTEADLVKELDRSGSTASVEITFGKSTSAGYQKAIEICQNIPSYEVSGEGKQQAHKVTLSITEAELIANLYDLVGSWKSSQMLINGRSSTKKDLTYYGVGCFRSRQKAYQPEQFCFGERQHEFNIWGCKRLNMPIYEWGGGWLSYGKFDKSGVWHLDKDKIRHELELGIKENELCPVLNRSRILDTLEKLPASINPKSDRNWEYQTTYEEVRGSYKEVAVGIKPIFQSVNRYIVGEFKPEWKYDDQDEKSADSIEVTVNLDEERAIKKGERSAGKDKKTSPVAWIALIIIVILIIANL